MGNRVRVKSSGMARGLANAWPPRAVQNLQMPRSSRGGWAPVELTGV